MNTLKTGLFLTALTLLLVLGGQAYGGRNGMTFALGIAVLMNGMAYFFSDKIALAASGAQPVTREQAPRLYEVMRSEEHTSELQSRGHLVCRLLLEKKKTIMYKQR